MFSLKNIFLLTSKSDLDLDRDRMNFIDKYLSQISFTSNVNFPLSSGHTDTRTPTHIQPTTPHGHYKAVGEHKPNYKWTALCAWSWAINETFPSVLFRLTACRFNHRVHCKYVHLLLEGWSPSTTTARLQPKNHFRFHLTQLLLLFYNFLSTTCNPLRFWQSTLPVPDEFSILKLLQLTLLALADRQASGLLFFILRYTADSMRHSPLVSAVTKK